jgi:hypothetical protein
MSKVDVLGKRFALVAAVLVAAAILTLTLAAPARAVAPSAAFDKGNRSFAEGHYAAAAANYEALAHTRGWSAPLLYDLGNAYAEQGRVGPAVLSYERARVLAPRDADIAANLAYVRARAGLPTPPSPWYRIVASYLSPAAWTWLTVVALWMGMASLLSVRRWHKRRLVPVGILALLVGVVGVAAVGVSDQNLRRAVVVENKSAPVRISPFDSAASERSLSEGEVVAVFGRHGDFVHVRDGRGRTGWIKSTTVQTIVPRTS